MLDAVSVFFVIHSLGGATSAKGRHAVTCSMQHSRTIEYDVRDILLFFHDLNNDIQKKVS